MRRLVEGGLTGRCSSTPSRRSSRSMEGLRVVVRGLQDHQISLHIQIVGLQTLIGGGYPVIMFVCNPQTFAKLHERDRKERQPMGIERKGPGGVES